MYTYVTSKEVKACKRDCESYFYKLKNKLKERGIQAQFQLIGSGKHRLVMRNGNSSFDLDYNLIITKMPKIYRKNPQKLKGCVRALLDEIVGENYFNGKEKKPCIKYVVPPKVPGKVEFSFDIEVIRKLPEDEKYLRLIHMPDDTFIWNQAPDMSEVDKKAKEIANRGKWNELRIMYQKLRNQYLTNKETDKPAFCIYAEAVNDVYNRIP